MKKVLIFFLVILFSICGYSMNQHNESASSTETTTLWIVTEQGTSDGMNYQIQLLVEEFAIMHPNVKIRLDILPTETQERATYLNMLYSLMDSHNGPDIFLLPTNDVLTLENPQKYTYLRISPLFPDVNIAMREGYFLDISELYDHDTELQKEHLNTTVMEAGVVDKKRYVIPLRYDSPVMYVYDNFFENNEISPDILYDGIDSWMEYVIESNDPILACSAEYVSMDAFSKVIEYTTGDLELTQEEAKRYLHLLQQVQTLIGSEYRHRTPANLEGYVFDVWTQFPVQISNLGNAIAYAAIAKANGQSLQMYPLRTIEGDFIATVKYYAAIGKSCDSPEIAYSFIRLFLAEEFQWEKNRLKPETDQYSGTILKSWPVLYVGATEPLWNNYKRQVNGSYQGTENTNRRQKTVLNLSINDSDVPILNYKLDCARFPVYTSPTIYEITSQLNDLGNGNSPLDVDFDKLSNILIESIYY